MNRGIHKQLHALCIAVSGIALAACSGGDMADLKSYVEKTLNEQKAEVEPLPEFKPYQTFLYQAGDLRSPFQPDETGQTEVAVASAGSNIHPDANRPREPLEAYPLDTLRMVGTLAQLGDSWALVQAPDGTIHRVQPGNHLGQNHGKIERITEIEVELTEIVPDGLGGWMERQASLALSE